MYPQRKYITLVLSCGLVFGTGYLCGLGLATDGPDKAATGSAAAPSATPRPTYKTQAPADDTLRPADAPATHQTPEIPTLTRLKVLAELNEPKVHQGFGYHCPIIGMISEGPLNPEFIYMFGLSSEETAKIGTALTEARQAMIELQKASQTAVFDPQTRTLIVQTPAMPAQGGVAYDQANKVIREVLGPERTPYFDQFSAASLEGAFNSFGLEASKATITTVQLQSGRVYYKLLQEWNRGSSTSVLDIASIRTSHPALADQITKQFKD